MNMEELVSKLNEACKYYYGDSGQEIMSNIEYDRLYDQLVEMEQKEGRYLPNSPTHKVGSGRVESLLKFKHPIPAKSLDKSKDVDKIVSTFQKYTILSNITPDVQVSWKLDGMTLVAYYKNGRLDNLVTRGTDGVEGSVITHNSRFISGLPLTVSVKEDMIVRGEGLISYKDFDEINSYGNLEVSYKNPRNLASASFMLLDSNEASKRKLHFKAFDLTKIEGIEDSRLRVCSGRLSFLKELGFDVVYHSRCTLDSLKHVIETFSSEVAEYEYPVDGLVCRMEDYEYAESLPGTEHNPHVMCGYALKWEDDCFETVLRDVEWSPSRTGLFNPVAIFDPVWIEGTSVSRASLHNVSYIKSKDLHLGDKVTVYKANKIIPQIDRNLSAVHADQSSIHYPEKCPFCGNKLSLISSNDTDVVKCENEECPEKLIEKFTYFCSKNCMDIQGMSEETIRKLVEMKFISSYSDFFKLNDHLAISFIPGLGKKSWSNMVKSAEKSRHCSFVKYLVSLGIPNIGQGQIKVLKEFIYKEFKFNLLSNHTELDYVTTLIDMVKTGFDFSSIDGFGSILSNNISKFVSDRLVPGKQEYDLISYLEFDSVKNETRNGNKLENMNFVITGSLNNFSNRKELVDLIESNGGKCSDSVSKNTSYLINNDVTSTSSKNKRATELGVPIITEEEFMSLI